MRTTTMLAALLLVVGASGCGSDESTDGGAEPGDAVVSPTRWSVATPPSPADDDLTIVVEIGSSSCNSLDRVDVDETAEAITIDAYVSEQLVEICTEDIAMDEVTVELDAPIGERRLLGCRPGADDDSSFDCR